MLAYAMCAAACVAAYLICGFPTAYVVAKKFAGVDVRTVGSGNVGATNVSRAAGAKGGIVTLLGDILKAVAAMFLGFILVGGIGCGGDYEAIRPGASLDWTMALVYLACVLGHMFTPYLHFKGGKGIAVGFGAAVVLMPTAGLLLWVPFLLFAVISKYVSLGSIAAAISLPFLAAIVYRPTVAFVAIVAVVAGLVIWAHRSNIKKLLSGTERKFSLKKQDK